LSLLASGSCGNRKPSCRIATDTSQAIVRIIRTDDELVIAKTVYRLLAERPAQPSL
jgi:acetate kinase